jgi:Protein of unknown function (DUF4038)
MSKPTGPLNFVISGRQILLDGEPRFILSDYALPLVGDATDDELTYYLDKRVSQGFTAVQIATLPVPTDRVNRQVLIAFNEELLIERGQWVFNENYFTRLSEVLQEFAKRRLLTLLGFYCHYVEDSRFARSTGSRYVMPPEVMSDYISLLSEALAPFVNGLIFMVNIDGTFHSDAEINATLAIWSMLRESLPGVRLSYYPAPIAVVPGRLAGDADLFIFQAGHMANGGDLPVELAVHYSALPQRPVIGIEAGYEYHRLVRGAGRFGRREVRRSMWRSVLAGGSSGAGYGQHGVWAWSRNGEPWTTEAASGSMLDWRDGLELPGAKDAVFVRRVMEEVSCVGTLFTSVRPAAPMASGWDAGMCSDSDDGAVSALYLPYGGPVDLEGCSLGDRVPTRIEAFDLETRLPLSAEISGSAGNLLLDLPGSHGDVVAFLRY